VVGTGDGHRVLSSSSAGVDGGGDSERSEGGGGGTTRMVVTWHVDGCIASMYRRSPGCRGSEEGSRFGTFGSGSNTG
jgi:hypothetical protein